MLLIVIGPIAYVLLRGRSVPDPGPEDRFGGTAINEEIRRKNTDWRA